MKTSYLIAGAALAAVAGLALLYARSAAADGMGSVRNDAGFPRLPSMPLMPNMPGMPSMTSGAAPNAPRVAQSVGPQAPAGMFAGMWG